MKKLNPKNIEINLERANPKSIQSANTVFHYVNRISYLYDMLENKEMYPRYCKEDLRPFNIDIKYIWIAMKCFCDIPLHKIKSHKKEYGDYCIGLSKEWGIDNELQPVFYYNENSNLVNVMKKAYEASMEYAGDDELLNDISGVLNENFKFMKSHTGEDPKINKIKCFTDEKEWRYVPNISDDFEFGEIIADQTIINNDDILKQYNNTLRDHDEYALKFDYDDIKYLFVKNDYQRGQLIKIILSSNELDKKKYRLISKINVWDETEGDF